MVDVLAIRSDHKDCLFKYAVNTCLETNDESPVDDDSARTLHDDAIISSAAASSRGLRLFDTTSQVV